jgi:single-stranded-DNA-specific exonuclease
LNNENSARQSAEKDVLTKAEEQVRLIDLDKTKALVLSGVNWHLGVIGIVASRLSEKYRRPVVMISVTDGIGKGSCRSIAAFDIYAALEKCSNILMKFGGHHQAAGLTMEEKHIDSLREALNAIVLNELRPEHYLSTLNIDAMVPLGEITKEFMDDLSKLAPHGAGNPYPAFAALDLNMADIRAIGQFSQHLKLKVKTCENLSRTFEVVAWNFGTLAKTFRTNEYIDIVFYPKYNEWQGNLNIQLNASDIRLKLSSPQSSDGKNFAKASDTSFADKSYAVLDREIIGKIYLLLKKDCQPNLSFRLTTDIIADRLYDSANIIISPKTADVALTILEELNLLSCRQTKDWYHINMLPAPPEKLCLTQSPTYRLRVCRTNS